MFADRSKHLIQELCKETDNKHQERESDMTKCGKYSGIPKNLKLDRCQFEYITHSHLMQLKISSIVVLFHTKLSIGLFFPPLLLTKMNQST